MYVCTYTIHMQDSFNNAQAALALSYLSHLLLFVAAPPPPPKRSSLIPRENIRKASLDVMRAERNKNGNEDLLAMR